MRANHETLNMKEAIINHVCVNKLTAAISGPRFHQNFELIYTGKKKKR